MEKKDFGKLLEVLSKIFDLKKDIEEIAKAQGVDLNNDESESDKDVSDDNENEADKDMEIAEELQAEYHSIMRWAFGNEFQSDSKKNSTVKWNKLHPDLPLPRVLTTNCIEDKYASLIAMIDLIPLYHAHMKSSK